MTFLRTYRTHLVIALLLIAGWYFLNQYAYSGSQEFDKRVTKVAEHLQKMNAGNSSEEERRNAIIEDIFKEQGFGFWRAMAGHLAEALLLAAVMIVAVEGPTRYLSARQEENFVERISSGFTDQVYEISANVWNAIFRKLVPDPIAIEVQKVLKSDICRLRPNYIITLSDGPYLGLRDDEIIVRRQLSYRLMNLTGDALEYPLKFTVKSHTEDRPFTLPNGLPVVLPRIVEVRVRQKKCDLDDSSRLQFKETVPLPAMSSEAQSWEVYSDIEEVLKTSDRTLYVQTAPCTGIDVLVINNSKKVNVLRDNVYLTSGTERLVSSMDGRWSYDGGLLSGTGLSVAWEPVPSSKAQN